MILNTNKCKSMTITRKRYSQQPFNYKITGATLEYVTSYKYLGVHISNDLTWHTHINYVCSSANRSLGYIRRDFSHDPSPLRLTLYRTLIRLKLEYASAIWDPAQQNLISLLESVQNRSARFILSDYSRTSSVSLMKNNLVLPSLHHRRKISRLSLFHKIYFHNPSIRRDLFSRPTYISSRIDHPFKATTFHLAAPTHSQIHFSPKCLRNGTTFPTTLCPLKIRHHSRMHFLYM